METKERVKQMSEELKVCQYDEIIATLDGAKGFFINASDVGNFDLAIRIVINEKNHCTRSAYSSRFQSNN